MARAALRWAFWLAVGGLYWGYVGGAHRGSLGFYRPPLAFEIPAYLVLASVLIMPTHMALLSRRSLDYSVGKAVVAWFLALVCWLLLVAFTSDLGTELLHLGLIEW